MQSPEHAQLSLMLLLIGIRSWLLIALGAVALICFGAFYLIRRRRRKTRPRLITIHPKSRVVLSAAGVKHCPACKLELKEGEARAQCSRDASHQIHDDCRELANGKCPSCNGPLL